MIIVNAKIMVACDHEDCLSEPLTVTGDSERHCLELLRHRGWRVDLADDSCRCPEHRNTVLESQLTALNRSMSRRG